MNNKPSDPTPRPADGNSSIDDGIRTLYQSNEGGVDASNFTGLLDRRLSATRRRLHRRPVVRRVALAGALVLCAAAVGIGAWQGVTHLGGGQQALLFGEAPDTSTSLPAQTEVTMSGYAVAGAYPSGAGSESYSIQAPSLVTKLKLLDVWKDAAAHFGIDPAAAKLGTINVSWSPDGTLGDFNLQARTADGHSIWVSAGGYPSTAADGRLTFNASTDQAFAADFGPEMGLTPGVNEVLAALDNAGLMTIGTQSGLDVSGDPAALWQTYSESQAQPAGTSAETAVSSEDTVAANDTIGEVLWTLNGGGNSYLLTDEQQAAQRLQWMQSTGVGFLAVSGGRVSHLDDLAAAGSLLPAVYLDLGREWITVDKATGQDNGMRSGGPATGVFLCDAVASQPGSTVQVQPVDSSLDGLAYAVDEPGGICRIENGAARTMWKLDTPYATGGASYGAGYSVGGSLLLTAGSVISVTSDKSGTFETYAGRHSGSGSQGGGEGQDEKWTYESTGKDALLSLPLTGGAPQELLRYDSLPGLNNVHYDQTTDSVWLSTTQDASHATLWTAHPHTAQLTPVPLQNDFSGDFAVSPDGSTIFYVGARQNQAEASLRTPDADEKLSLGLATTYMPVFSPDGSKVCLVGSAKLDDSTSLWLFDVATGSCTKIASTEGLTPTYPVFSPDGQRIAFRDWALGDIWTVNPGNHELRRYSLNAGEAPIAW